MTAQDRGSQGAWFVKRSGSEDRILGPARYHRAGRAYQCRQGLLHEVARTEAQTEDEASADFRRQMRPQGDNKIIEPDMAEPHDWQFSLRPESLGCIDQVDGLGNRCFDAGESHRGGVGA